MKKAYIGFMVVLFGATLTQGAVLNGDIGGSKYFPPPELLLGPGPGGTVALETNPPRSMRNLVLHAGHREIHTLILENTEYRYLAPFSELPFLLWPAEGRQTAPFAHDRAKTEKWLGVHGETLGLQGFEVVFRETGEWWGNEVWSYDLVREGFRLHGSNIDVHWRDGRLEGLLCNLPGPVHGFDKGGSSSDDVGSNRIWFPVPRGVGWRDGADVVLALVDTKVDGPNIRSTYTHPSGELLTTVVSPLRTGDSTVRRAHQWTEYNIPYGTFPDQIDSDSQGLIWYSQPLNDRISIFDPVSETFDEVITGNDDPDGLMVDPNDIVWSGLYVSNRGLGRVNVNTHDYSVFAPPYTGSLMAIPFWSTQGTVWVSDHQNNRMSEFDPVAESWLGTYIMPTSSCWVVDTAENPATQTLYFTEFNVNQLGMKEPGNPIQDIPVSFGGPSFNGYSNGKVYYTLWTRAVLGAYDVISGTNTEYNHPVAGEYGGPMDILSTGDVAVGSLNSGYVFVFRIATETWESYDIPTSYPGLKDGLHVDDNDVIWITESFSDKIAKLVIEPLLDPTISAELTCQPTSGMVPFVVNMTATLDNLYDGTTRRIAGRINVTLASGGSYNNWKTGWTNVAASSSSVTSWNQTIPALGPVIGNNVFTLEAEDVTPAPFNQSPHPPSGDTDSSVQAVLGIAP